MANERWLPTLGYELALINGATHVLKRGGRFVKESIVDEETTYRTIAVATDYDEAVRILRALRGTLAGSSSVPEEANDG